MQAVIIIAILLDLEIAHSPLNDSFILTSLEMFVYLNYQHSHYMIIWLSLKTVATIWVYFPFWKLSVPMKSQYKYSQMYLRYRYTSTDKQDAILMFIYKFRLTKKYLNSWPLALQAIHFPQSHISSWGWSPLKLKCYNCPVSLNHFTG